MDCRRRRRWGFIGREYLVHYGVLAGQDQSQQVVREAVGRGDQKPVGAIAHRAGVVGDGEGALAVFGAMYPFFTRRLNNGLRIAPMDGLRQCEFVQLPHMPSAMCGPRAKFLNP